jgi:small subunit ribosomal protein S8
MTMTDPIADMLTRVRNASSAFKDSTTIPSSTKVVEIARILKDEGYVEDYQVVSGSPQDTLEVTLKYGPRRERTIKGIRRISKPGLRVYAKKDELPRVLGGLGVAVISTSSGVMTDKQARVAGVGGEVVAYIW